MRPMIAVGVGFLALWTIAVWIVATRTHRADTVPTSVASDPILEADNSMNPGLPSSRAESSSKPARSTSNDQCRVDPGAGRSVLRAVGMIAKVPEYSEANLEQKVNSITPYLAGLIQGLRAADPRVMHQFRDELADKTCRTDRTDFDLAVFAKLAILQPELGSSRAINCALEGRKQEDYILWSVLDVWNASGRQPVPALASIERTASDERTRRRLLPISEQHRRPTEPTTQQ